MLDFCSECGKKTAWEEEDVGAQAVLVCKECGNCKESIPFEAEEDESSATPSGSQLVHYDQVQTKANGKYFKQSTTERNRELRFIEHIKKIASAANLPKQSTARCVSCGKMVLKSGYNLRRRAVRVAAALVYLDQQSMKRSLFMKDFAKQVGIRLGYICQEVKRLKAEFGEQFAKTEVKPAECLQSVVDELATKLNLPNQQKKDVYKTAMELREITRDTVFRGHRMSDAHKLSHCTYFSLALDIVNPSHQEVWEKMAGFTGYKVSTLKQKIYAVRKKLLALAKTLPSADQHYLTLQNIRDYIPTILRNKTFLTKGEDRFYVCGGSKEMSEDGPPPPEFSCATSQAWEEGLEEEDERTLSDLDSDVDQYIASEKEVEEKRASLEQMELDSAKITKTECRHPKTRKGRGKKSSSSH